MGDVTSSVRIKMTEHGRGEVFINGERVPHVVSVKFEAGVDEVNSVSILLNPRKVELESEITVVAENLDNRDVDPCSKS